jgi:hypothetical protein
MTQYLLLSALLVGIVNLFLLVLLSTLMVNRLNNLIEIFQTSQRERVSSRPPQSSRAPQPQQPGPELEGQVTLPFELADELDKPPSEKELDDYLFRYEKGLLDEDER